MIINGLKLPSLFVEIVHEGTLRRKFGSWQLREDVDAFGNHLESELDGIYETENKIILETKKLSEDFPSIFDEDSDTSLNEPGFISYIVDFSKIICFGMSGDGAPFCFDYRNSLGNPSVIWWDDIYWREIAPDFGAFITLFNLEKTV